MFQRVRFLWSEMMMLWRTITLALLNVNLRGLGSLKHTLLGHASPSSSQEVGSIQTATLQQIRLCAEPGFGESSNRYAFAMQVFKDRLFVGTSHIIRPIPGIYQFALGKSPASQGAQLWSMNPTDPAQAWTPVIQNGLHHPSNFAIRALYACPDLMVAATVNHDQGLEIWGTLDGTQWMILSQGGFGNVRNTSGRGIIEYQNHFYFTTENRKDGAELWRCSREELRAALHTSQPSEHLSSHWECVAVQGLGDRANSWFSDFVVYEDRLWVGTMNNSRGFSLFSSVDGNEFSVVLQRGHTTRNQHAAMKLIVFKGELYLSTMNWIQGFSIFAIKLAEDGSPVVEEVLSKGFTTVFNSYVWQMCVYQDRLYAGTFQNSFLGLRLGMFSLLSSADGRDWVIETDTAFGSRWPWFRSPQVGDYGIRSMLVYQESLYLGTATAHNQCKIYQAQSRFGGNSMWKVAVEPSPEPPLPCPLTVEEDRLPADPSTPFQVPFLNPALLNLEPCNLSP